MMKESLPPNTVERWLKVLEEWQASTESIANFCSNRKISRTSFYQWRSKLLPNDKKSPLSKESKVSTQAFLPVEFTNPQTVAPADGDSIDLFFPTGCKLSLRKGFDTELLRQVVMAIGEMKP